jgi:hypothetical protein
MAKQAYVYSGTDWVPLASEVTNLTGYQTKALNQFAHRNLVINGDMQIAQRSSSVASITAGGYNTADRWRTLLNTQGTWTQSVENDAPTGSGFRKSLKMLCTTADASPAAGDYVAIDSLFEGQNLQHIKKGTAAAEQLTVSFWVKSNVTGTYIFNISDQDNNRQVSKSYTINASGTWEYKTITFPADTTGALDNDNARSLDIRFYLGAGSNTTSGTLATTWQSYTEANTAVGQVNVASAISNYWQVTGVQLEVGDTATPFEFKPIDAELAECQRYYYRNTPGNLNGNYCLAQVRSTTQVEPVIHFPVTMRTVPTSLEFSNLAILRAGTSVTAITGATLPSDESTPNSAKIAATTSASGASAGQVVTVTNNNSTAGYLAFSAEL